MTPLLVIIAILAAAAVVLLLVLLLRKPEAAFGDRVRVEVDRLSGGMRDELRLGREEGASAARQLREEVTTATRASGDSIAERLGEIAKQQIDHLQTFSTALTDSSERGEQRLAEMRTTLDQRLAGADEAAKLAAAQTRQELQASLKSFSELLAGQLQELSHALKQQLADLTTRNEAKLEAMRVTVDEKLHETLEKRLGESFRLVSERLEQVHTGLGEMKSLAVGVGDLKKILSNVKTRGTWGEVQLGNLLEQTLTPEQFMRNFAPDPASAERVEFAIRLPGRDADGTPVWLPIDSKFPHEEYQRLVDAQERADAAAAEAAGAALEQGIRVECRKISEKYLRPPITTDFGILFLPTEGLFAELLRRPGLTETLQRDFRVVVSGPTTLTALLTSLQMGFRTLAIEQRSSEVWKVLGAVKTEFGKFGEALDKVHKKLTEASNSIESAQRRQRMVERKLKPADGLPAPDAVALLGIDAERTEEDSEPADE